MTRGKGGVPVSEDFLTKTEFYQYMGKFEKTLEGRLTKLEGKITNNHCSSMPKDELLADLLKMAIGALLLLGGVAGGKFLL